MEIIATLVRQREDLTDESREELDVTERILKLNLKQLKELTDDDYDTDDLIEGADIEPITTPFRIEVVGAIEKLFGVITLEDITKEMFKKMKRKWKNLEDKEFILNVKILREEEVNVKAKGKTPFEALQRIKKKGHWEKERDGLPRKIKELVKLESHIEI